MKKLLISTIAILLLLAAVVGSGYAAPSAENLVPFKGTLYAVENQVVTFPTMHGNGSGSGNATHLGEYTLSYLVTVNLLTFSASGSAHLVAANGDSIDAAGTGQSFATDTPTIRRIVETYTITGGTGRFAGAGGSFTVERLINRSTGETSGTFDGSITMP